MRLVPARDPILINQTLKPPFAFSCASGLNLQVYSLSFILLLLSQGEDLLYKASGLCAHTFPSTGLFALAKDFEQWCD